MDKEIGLAKSSGIRLVPTDTAGVARAVVEDASKKDELTWDRYMRLFHTSSYVREMTAAGENILDVGGFDGALSFFLPGYTIDVIDPATTGGCALKLPDIHYHSVVSIDCLEHISPPNRKSFVDVILNAAEHACFINFPSARSLEAQKMALEITNNHLIREHVEWPLPDVDEFREHIESRGFTTRIYSHTSTAQWLPQYILQTIAPAEAVAVSRYLLANHMDDPIEDRLYDLLISTRNF